MHDGAKNENDSISQALVSNAEFRIFFFPSAVLGKSPLTNTKVNCGKIVKWYRIDAAIRKL